MIKTNEYFGGNVKSLAVENSEGVATIGVIAPGEYEFGTATIELMHIVSGNLDVQLPGENTWKTFSKGMMFRVEKNEKFKVKAEKPVGYFCQYI